MRVIRVIRITSVKFSIGILTHQGYISKVNANAHSVTQLLSYSVTLITSRASCDAKKTLLVLDLLPSPSVLSQNICADKFLPMRCCQIYKQGEEGSSHCGPGRQCLPRPSAGSRCRRDLGRKSLNYACSLPHLNFCLGTHSSPSLQTIETCFLAGSIMQRSPSQSVPGIQHRCHVVALQFHISFCTFQKIFDTNMAV